MQIKTGGLSRLAWMALLFAAIISPAALAQANDPSPAMTPSADQIVQQMVTHNKDRADRLQHYTAVRHYAVEYRGFPGNIAASMDVEATYDAPSSKSFHIVSQSGSKLLVDHVLKKLLESETEASQNQARFALTPANYTFTLTGEESANGQHFFVLSVEPRVDNKFLYRGKIWVDTTDYAVAKIEAQPAKNPSFWIKRTDIHHTYTKTGDFWLPERNRSESNIRIGGNAVLTIDYGTYRLQATAAPAASPAGSPTAAFTDMPSKSESQH